MVNLEKIYIPDNYETELPAPQQSHDLVERGYTNNESEAVMRKSLTYSENDLLEQAVFMNKRLV